MTVVDHNSRDGATLSPLVAALLFGLAAVAMVRSQAGVASGAGRAGTAQRRGQRKSAAVAWLDNGRHILLSLYRGISQHRVLAIAAGVAFYSLLAIFPALAALVSLYGLFANPSAITTDLQQFAGVLPAGAIDVIRQQLVRVASQQHGTLGLTFLISFVVSLWSANSGMSALFDALNVVRGETEKRSLLKLYGTSLAFTSGAIGFLILAIGAVVVLPIVLNFFGFAAVLPMILSDARWPFLFIVTALGLDMIYRYGPCCKVPRWRWISWGSAFAALLWIGASYLFSWYTAHFGSYNRTYGSLGAVIGFMTWIWISITVVLLGAELDAAIAGRRATTQAAESSIA